MWSCFQCIRFTFYYNYHIFLPLVLRPNIKIHTPLILADLSYGREFLFLALRGRYRHRLTVFENKELKATLGLGETQSQKKGRNLHNKFHNLLKNNGLLSFLPENVTINILLIFSTFIPRPIMHYFLVSVNRTLVSMWA